MTNSQILMAALAYAQCGNWQEVADSFDGLTVDCIRMAVQRASETNEALKNAIDDGKKLSAILIEKKRRAANQVAKQYHVRTELSMRRDREIHAMRTAQPSPVTLGQKMMGEPLPGRSALDKIKANNRRDDTETDPRFIRRVFGSDNSRRNVVTLPNIQLSQTI